MSARRKKGREKTLALAMALLGLTLALSSWIVELRHARRQIAAARAPRPPVYDHELPSWHPRVVIPDPRDHGKKLSFPAPYGVRPEPDYRP